MTVVRSEMVHFDRPLGHSKLSQRRHGSDTVLRMLQADQRQGIRLSALRCAAKEEEGMSHYSITCTECGYQIELNRRDYRIEEWLDDKNRKFDCPTCGGRGEVEDLKARRTKADPPRREVPLQEKETAVQSRAQRLVVAKKKPAAKKNDYLAQKEEQRAKADFLRREGLDGSPPSGIPEYGDGDPRPGWFTDEDWKKGRKRYDG